MYKYTYICISSYTYIHKYIVNQNARDVLFVEWLAALEPSRSRGLPHLFFWRLPAVLASSLGPVYICILTCIFICINITY